MIELDRNLRNLSSKILTDMILTLSEKKIVERQVLIFFTRKDRRGEELNS